MELLVKVKKQGALQEHEYKNKQGVVERFATMPFLLQRGSDTFYCEMVQEQARKQGALLPEAFYMASISLQARPWKDQSGAERYETRITLNRISPL